KRLGGATPPLMQSIKLDLGFQKQFLSTSPAGEFQIRITKTRKNENAKRKGEEDEPGHALVIVFFVLSFFRVFVILFGSGHQTLVCQLLKLDGTQSPCLALDVRYLQLRAWSQHVLILSGEGRKSPDADRLHRGHFKQSTPAAGAEKAVRDRALGRA